MTFLWNFSKISSSISCLKVIEIFVWDISNSNISNFSCSIKSNIFLITSIFLIIPLPIIEILERSFFTMLFIVFSYIISEITVPGLLLNVDFVIIGILYFSPISMHLL